jgi:hypothetical protein
MAPSSIRFAAALAVCSAVIGASAVATADAEGHKTQGSFSTSCSWRCWGEDELVDGLHGSDVWCSWTGDHVALHLKLRNRYDGDVVATVKPTYWVRKNGRHGSSFHSLKNIEIDANSTVEWTGDAGKPENVPAGAPIERCTPSLYAIRRT